MTVVLTHVREASLVRKFFGDRLGFFVEVGANHPHEESQTWDLDRRGWTGVLIEPQPVLAANLREKRTAQVFAVACSSPDNSGRTLPFYVAGAMLSLDRKRMAPGAVPETVIEVPAKTLDEVLIESKAPVPIDFLSIDVEGHELDVLRGFDFGRWQPRLILLEDHVANLDKHRFLTAAGYRVVKRFGFNGWYVPVDAAVNIDCRDRWEILRKYYLALPFRIFRNASRHLRQPFKDRQTAAARRSH